MYTVSKRLKTFSLALIVIGLIGTVYSFMNTPKTIEDVKAMQSTHETHGASHEAVTTHQEKTTHMVPAPHETNMNHETATEDGHNVSHDAHAAHTLHQLKNRPWAAFYVALFFFLGVTLLVLAFYAIQRVAQAGWSIVLFRVMEAITANLLPASIIMFLMIVAAAMHIHHLFPWMAEGTVDPTSPNYDAIIDGKSWWLNIPGWAIRGTVYLIGWNLYRMYIRKHSIAQDNGGTLETHKKGFNISVMFLFFFMISETLMSWDWIMGLDPHWFSTLFGWYIFSSLMVSAITVIAFVTIYLRSKGHLPFVNDSHIHDLAKFMFGFSVFWTYLWFSQFMLIWYANMPEETTYFAMRFNEYKIPFLSMIVMNFIFPILVLMNSDYKGIPWFIVIAGIIILIGHYVDIFIMVMPATVGANWAFGIPEISALLFFLGIFIYTVFNAFAKAKPLATGNPFIKESEEYHYYNIEHREESASEHH